MNSVLEIGENIMFIDSGENKWTGTKNEILDVKVKELHDFICFKVLTANETITLIKGY